jgi:magnesium chelatase subunit D
LHIVMLDTSASVLSGQGFAKAKAWLLALAEQAYQRREQLAVIGFGKQQVELLMSRRRAPKAIRQWLDQLSAGGGTPLADALQYAAQLQQQVSRKTPGVELHSYLLSDGRISDLGQLPLLAGSVTVVDVEQAAVPRGIGRRIADALGAQYVGLSSPALYRPVC